jgi:hypothetical protein
VVEVPGVGSGATKLAPTPETPVNEKDGADFAPMYADLTKLLALIAHVEGVAAARLVTVESLLPGASLETIRQVAAKLDVAIESAHERLKPEHVPGFVAECKRLRDSLPAPRA